MSFLARVFARILKSKVENDPILTDIINNAESDLAKSRKEILEQFDGDEEKIKIAIPKKVREYLGFDF